MDIEFSLSLTGENSHDIKIMAGQGSFSIGTIGISQGDYDAWVDVNDKINWHSFDKLNFSKVYKWPRSIEYSGNDTGFVDWSYNRKIEKFYWIPQSDVHLNMTKANIRYFYLDNKNFEIELSLGNLYQLTLLGKLNKIKIKDCLSVFDLTVDLAKTEIEDECYQLPIYKKLKDITSIRILNKPLNKPFDCRSLLQFPNLKEVSLVGNITNLNVLKNLTKIEFLGLWDVPDLEGLPGLKNWENLYDVIGSNIEKRGGQILRRQLKELQKEKKMDEFCYVGQLRDKNWYVTEYNIPFYNWEKHQRKAIKIYKEYLGKLKSLDDEETILKEITNFIKFFNSLSDIETIEREDIFTAVKQLIGSTKLVISEDKIIDLFDSIRDF